MGVGPDDCGGGAGAAVVGVVAEPVAGPEAEADAEAESEAEALATVVAVVEPAVAGVAVAVSTSLETRSSVSCLASALTPVAEITASVLTVPESPPNAKAPTDATTMASEASVAMPRMNPAIMGKVSACVLPHRPASPWRQRVAEPPTLCIWGSPPA